MSIPPFPSQDLAKLVLGYLAEEQLMTAYDEFLQASPYLDALRNEYDRIFMTSLKSILAEYRAVKIYVDTCKPFILRKKVFQCSNLLEVVKFLVTNVDIKKIQQQEANERASLEKQSSTITLTPSPCELCHSLSLPNCICKHRTEVKKPIVNASHVEVSSFPSSVEATPLADLPGNHVTMRKKHGKIVDKDSVTVNYNVSLQSSDSTARQSITSNISPEEYLARCESSPSVKTTDSTLSLNSTVKLTDPSKSKQNIEEFNNVLKSVVSRNKTLSGSECPPNQRISNAGTFQDFASGVSGGENRSATYNVPDSSTSEISNARAPLRKDVYNDNIKGPPPSQLMLRVSHVNDAIEIQTCKSNQLPKLMPKTTENQIKILSDIKVNNKLSDKLNASKKKPIVASNATSTPLMQMQTIMINGTPAYKHSSNAHAFTKDEIMAMPTLIVVPASGPSQIPTSAHCNSIMAPSANVISEANSSPPIFGPLVIDVPPNSIISNKPTMDALPDLSEQKLPGDLVKTVDVKNSNGTAASVPKDNVISVESNTPQVLPPMRKSSSTPRRSSHIRVLDFTTPRRILHETINEQVPSQSSEPQAETVVSGSEITTNVPATEPETISIKSNIVIVVKEEGNTNDTGSTKENETDNKTKQTKKYDWDADLRALVANEKPANVSHRKPKPKASKKKKSDKNSAVKDSESKKKTRSKHSPRVKKSRNIEELEEESSPNIDRKCDIPVKPTVKIICGDKKTDLQGEKGDGINKNKSNEKSEECVDTPETERLSLQNVIGAKLNISDFLETPYKQALYDIQMETPRFLGPDLPDEPLSDIKIMNIPTPRFLNTPNLAQATPSYASRATDYSSGGSYYKPDDQDYMPIPDLTVCPVTSSKEDLSTEQSVDKDNDGKKSRPVRKCAKNVSYYRSSGAVKKDVEDNIDATSSCSDTVSANSSFEFKSKKETAMVKTPRAKAQSTSRIDGRKKTSSCKRRKSPKSTVKEKPKSFMKIKPKYTPKKVTPTKNGKRNMCSPYSKVSSNVTQRKRTTSKDRSIATSALVPATTKSRRKSSTPRKLNYTKTYNSEVSSHSTSDNISDPKLMVTREKTNSNTHDSDTDQIALRWSDEGSEDGKLKEVSTNATFKETEDINKIQEFIVSTGVNKTDRINDGALQRDLMKRGFDSETAKIIERDLLDDTPLHTELTKNRTLPIETVQIVETKKDDSLDKTAESSVTNELQIAQDESDNEIELSVHECNEESDSYFVFKHDDTKEVTLKPPIKIKDNYTMEICIEDVTMTLKAPPFRLVLDQDPLTVDEIDYSYKETEQAVKSISGMEKLYTPLKDFKSQCFEIFDSTLTSIDTPLKATSPVRKSCDVTVTELVLEGDKVEAKETEAKRRKRARSNSNDSANSSKRTKPDADLLLKAANIQNIDIETVLTKLHGH